MSSSVWIIQAGSDKDMQFVVNHIAGMRYDYKVIDNRFIRVHSAPESLGLLFERRIKEEQYDADSPFHIFRRSEVI